MDTDDHRILRVSFGPNGSVDVTGYLQFTQAELFDLADSVTLTARKRPADYVPLYHFGRGLEPLCHLQQQGEQQPNAKSNENKDD